MNIRPAQPAPNPAFLKEAFQLGQLKLKGQFTLGSNYAFLVKVEFDGQSLSAVYKPSKGEQPLWDFTENSLALREVAAYQVSQFLGWNLVPYTILRQEGPYGSGSLQQFIKYDPNEHYFTFTPEQINLLQPVVLFDLLINNADRKGSHIFFEKETQHLYAIDHGLCFHTEDKLRTVIWDFAERPINPNLINDLQRLIKSLAAPEGLATVLEAFLSADETRALTERAETLMNGGTFPAPPADRRAFPYPPL